MGATKRTLIDMQQEDCSMELKRSERNYGIDLLRIISMLSVLLLHILGSGGILSTAPQFSLNYEVAWLLETMAFCAVNCYALISGYVGVSSIHKYSSLVTLWLQVAFYTIGITAIYSIFSHDITFTNIIFALFPVSNQYYWYFTAYFGMFFLIPILNLAVNSLNERSLKVITITLFAVFSVLPTLAKSDVFRLGDGYDLLWLTLLYFIGGCIKKCGWFSKTPAWKAGVVYLASVLLSWGLKYLLELNLIPYLSAKISPYILINYTSPTIFATGISLLVLFMNMNITAKVPTQTIKFFAPLAFSVYLIQEHPLIRTMFIHNRFSVFAQRPLLLMLLEIIATTFAIFFIATGLDLIRHYLFKLLRIKERLNNLEQSVRERMTRKK